MRSNNFGEKRNEEAAEKGEIVKSLLDVKIFIDILVTKS